MAFQKCPACNGRGWVEISVRCSVCKGEKIINTITGKPPSSITNSDDDINGGINGHGESQQEYFGKR